MVVVANGLIKPLHMDDGDIIVGIGTRGVEMVKDGEGELSDESLVAGGRSISMEKSLQALSLNTVIIEEVEGEHINDDDDVDSDIEEEKERSDDMDIESGDVTDGESME